MLIAALIGSTRAPVQHIFPIAHDGTMICTDGILLTRTNYSLDSGGKQAGSMYRTAAATATCGRLLAHHACHDRYDGDDDDGSAGVPPM